MRMIHTLIFSNVNYIPFIFPYTQITADFYSTIDTCELCGYSSGYDSFFFEYNLDNLMGIKEQQTCKQR